MNEPNTDSEQTASDNDEALDLLRAPPFNEEWLDTMMRNMKRMTTDEADRLEIEQRLS